MLSDPSRHTADRPFVESLLRRVPGFNGYLEKEYRRDSDRMVREYMAKCFEQAKVVLEDLSRGLADARHLELLPEIDRIRGRLDKLIGKVRGAMQGYSGFFDLVQIDKVRLTEIYEHDLALVQRAEVLQEAVKLLPEHVEHLAGRFRDLFREVDKFEHQWNARDRVLKG